MLNSILYLILIIFSSSNNDLTVSASLDIAVPIDVYHFILKCVLSLYLPDPALLIFFNANYTKAFYFLN